MFFDYAGELKEKLGPVLWQLPPGMKADKQRLKDFCRLLLELSSPKNVPQVFEFRHSSWFCEDVYAILKKHKFILCIAHSSRWPRPEEVIATGNMVYLRFHGGEELYGSNYSDRELNTWAQEAKKWLKEKKPVYAYFNNDAHGFAPKNALRFREILEKCN